MRIEGLHHITLVCGDARRTADFYTRVLGMRLIKKTVNFDAPSSYHLYFGDRTGSPGTVITFFEWPNAPKGNPGIGGTHHFALAAPDFEALLRWKRRLTDQGAAVHGPYERGVFRSIYFRDPDGVLLEISTPSQRAGDEREEEHGLEAQTWPEPVDVLTPELSLVSGMHHISATASDLERTHRFYSEVLGLELVYKSFNRDNPEQAHWFWRAEKGLGMGMITYFQADVQRTRHAQIGRGQTHHFALSVADEEAQLRWRDRLLSAGIEVSPVLDRKYFKSIYTQDPDGHIVELATAGPGFLVDEPEETLGQALQLPPWLERYREQIERQLQPVDAPLWVAR